MPSDSRAEAQVHDEAAQGVPQERRAPGSWTRRPGWHWALMGLLVAALFPALAIFKTVGQASTEQAAARAALAVRAIRLQPVSDYTLSTSYAGEIVARRTSSLGFEQPGTIISIDVEEGDRVQAGQVIARQDTRSLLAQRQQVQAQIAQAVAQLEERQVGPRPEDIAAARAQVADLEQQLLLAQRQRERREFLYKAGAISQEALDEKDFGSSALASRRDQAQSQLDELLAGTRPEQIAAQAAQVKQLEASLAAIDIQLAKSVLKAPFNGQIAARLVDEGVVASAGQSVLRLVEDGLLEARVGVPVSVAQRLKPGQRQLIQAGSRTVPGEIAALLPEVDGASRTVTVVVQMTPEADLAIGQTARLGIQQTQTASGYWLPATALVAGERGLWSAYVLKAVDDVADRDNRYEVVRRDVEVLHTEGDRVLVRGMVRRGERVIASGVHRVVPGQQVTIQGQ